MATATMKGPAMTPTEILLGLLLGGGGIAGWLNARTSSSKRLDELAGRIIEDTRKEADRAKAEADRVTLRYQALEARTSAIECRVQELETALDASQARERELEKRLEIERAAYAAQLSVIVEDRDAKSVEVVRMRARITELDEALTVERATTKELETQLILARNGGDLPQEMNL